MPLAVLAGLGAGGLAGTINGVFVARFRVNALITTLGTMFDKKYVTRSQQGNAFYFSPRVGHDEVSRRMLGDLVNRVFDGSAAAVMLRLFECSERRGLGLGL